MVVMKLEQLYYLTEAIKFGSISIAARENYVPQSTVSTSITRLEKELETSLLKRTNKGIFATEAGQEIAEKSKQIFSLLDEIRSSACNAENRFALNIVAMPSLIDTVLADVFIEIEKNNHPLMVNVVTDEPNVILQNVQLGLSDLGIVFDNQPFHYPDLTYKPLFIDSYCLFVGKNSPYYQRDSISINEALTCHHITYKTEYERETNLLTRMISPYGKPDIALRVDNTESMRRIIAKSQYVAFFPHFTTYHDAYIESEKIKALPIHDANLTLYIGYIESRNFRDLQGNQIFLKLLQKIVQENNYQQSE